MLLNIILFVLLLSVIVLIHEFGHFITAKLFNVYVQEFSIGMGPKVFSKKGKETEYSIRALPIGGFVAMAGDESNESVETQVDTTNIPKDRCLNNIHPLKRVVVMSAGIIMNFVLAIVIVSMVYLSFGQISVAGKPVVEDVLENYPAYGKIEKGDYIKEIEFTNGYKISPRDFDEISTFLAAYDGVGEITFTIDRNGENVMVVLTPVYNEEMSSYMVGIQSAHRELVKINFFNSFKYGFDYLINITKITLVALLGLFRGVGFENLGGPVAVYQVTSQAVSMGLITYLNLMAILSVNIGLMNALPLPILDGGRIVLLIIESIIKRPISKKVQNFIMSLSAALLILLVILITFKDIMKLI